MNMAGVVDKVLDKPEQIAIKSFEIISQNKDSTILRYLVIVFSILAPYCIFSIFPNTLDASSVWLIMRNILATTSPIFFVSVSVYVATEAMRRKPSDANEHHNDREHKILNAELLTVSLMSGYLSFFGAYFVAYAAWWISGLFHLSFGVGWIIPITYVGYVIQMMSIFCKYYFTYMPTLTQ